MSVPDYKTVIYDYEIRQIGVVSDTHIPSRGRFLPPALFSMLDGVQLVLHAGDLVDEKVINELAGLAPVEAVAGNMDSAGTYERLGRFKLLQIGDISIGLMHGDIAGHRFNYRRAAEIFAPEKPQAIVFGHLHRPVVEYKEGILFFNPGSAVDPRQALQPSCGKLVVEGGRVNGEIIYL